MGKAKAKAKAAVAKPKPKAKAGAKVAPAPKRVVKKVRNPSLFAEPKKGSAAKRAVAKIGGNAAVRQLTAKRAAPLHKPVRF